jgi:hypothetical protein
MTRPEIDRYRYAVEATRLGVQYYVAGRFSLVAHLIPVAANLLHHALEMLLKAAIAQRRGLEGLHRKHHLPTLWRTFGKTFPHDDNAALVKVIQDLHAFEHIRYPQDMIREGSAITFSFEDANAPISRGEGEPLEVPQYSLAVGAIDKLVRHIVSIGSLNPDAALLGRSDVARDFLSRRNNHPIL